MKIFTGKVISTKMDKTATIAVERVLAHPVYKKRIKLTKKYHVHTESPVEVGQVVRFVASKPYSKLKKWKAIGVEADSKKLPQTKSSSEKKSSKPSDTKKKGGKADKKAKSRD
jgi:small subunit ribosomal protein S17